MLPASGYPQIDMARCWSWPCVSRRDNATSPGSPSARIHQRHSTSSDTRPWNSANFPHYSPRHIRKCLSKRLAPDTLPETRQPKGTFVGELSSACFISSPRRAGAVTSVFQRPSNIATQRAFRAETPFFVLALPAGDNSPQICAAESLSPPCRHGRRMQPIVDTYVSFWEDTKYFR